MSQPRHTDPIGTIGWTERTGGVLTARECLTLARPLRVHSGRSSIDPANLRLVLASGLCAEGSQRQRDDRRRCSGCSVLRLLDDLGPQILGASKLPCFPRTGLGLDPEQIVELLNSEREVVAGVDDCQ